MTAWYFVWICPPPYTNRKRRSGCWRDSASAVRMNMPGDLELTSRATYPAVGGRRGHAGTAQHRACGDLIPPSSHTLRTHKECAVALSVRACAHRLLQGSPCTDLSLTLLLEWCDGGRQHKHRDRGSRCPGSVNVIGHCRPGICHPNARVKRQGTGTCAHADIKVNSTHFSRFHWLVGTQRTQVNDACHCGVDY